MSTLAVNIITDANGGNNARLNGPACPDNSMGFRNRIINGDMRIAQRGTAAVTASGAFPVDRFQVVNITDGAFSAQQDSSAPTGFVNSLKFTITTADTSLTTNQLLVLVQRIEGTNVSDLAWGTANAQAVTLSFWVRSSLTGTFGGWQRNGAVNRSYPFTYTISAADTWEQKYITIAGDTSGTWLTTTSTGINVVFGLGNGPDISGTAGAWAGSNFISATGATSVVGTNGATWYITGVQLEVGSVATPFERRPYGTELALCQRYYVRYTTTSGSDFIFVGAANIASNVRFVAPLSLRSSPSISFSGIAANDGAVQNSISAITNIQATSNSVGFDASTTGMTAGRAAVLVGTSASQWIDFSSEL